MTRSTLVIAAASVVLCGTVAAQPGASPPVDANTLFAPIRQVLQSPRCQNCHIPGDAPLQHDVGVAHAQNVKRGTDGKGFAALRCAACHQAANAPDALGPHAPPGAPGWHLPPENLKMIFIGLSARDLCLTVKDPRRNGNRSTSDFVRHMADDKLVDWGWHPGGERAPVPVSKDDTVAAVKAWVAAGAPCPAS